MTGGNTFDGLTEFEKKHTLTLGQFLELANEAEFDKRFPPTSRHPKVKMLNRDFQVFDDLILGKGEAPKKPRLMGYDADELIFTHPRKAYKESIAKHEKNHSDLALMRTWNFEKIEGTQSATSKGRTEIVSKEKEILSGLFL